ncbi:MAG: acyl carrier protein [Bacteroidota bacterium]
MNVLEIIYEGIDDLNQDLEPGEQLEKNEEATIFGPDSKLDSMGLVNLITIIEEKLEKKTGRFISIADERAMSMEASPFKTIGTLKNYITDLINE